MNISLKVDTSGALLAGKGPDVVQTALDGAITEATMLLLAEVKKRTPQGVFGAQGRLLGSINAEVSGKGTPMVRGEVASVQKYAEVVEKGLAAGKGIPLDALTGWIQVKLGISSAKEIRQVAFLISRKAKLKGIEGHYMFEKALNDNLSRVEAIFERQGLRIAQELSA